MLSELKDQKAFEAAVGDQLLTIVHFHAPWAEQCAQVNEVLEAFKSQKAFSNVKFYSCPAEELSEVSSKYNIEAVPTVIFFRSGESIEIVHGADIPKISATLKKHISSSEHTNNSTPLPLEEKLKYLINKSKVMLFMKGDRNAPRCGFSRQIIEILNNTGALYETFDILSDEEVRQGLKTYSDWPTYPQLYVNGELIGGLDIVKEMLAAGELQATLSV